MSEFTAVYRKRRHAFIFEDRGSWVGSRNAFWVSRWRLKYPIPGVVSEWENTTDHKEAFDSGDAAEFRSRSDFNAMNEAGIDAKTIEFSWERKKKAA